MWTSRRSAQEKQHMASADCGRVTLEGDPAGVYLGGERRWMPVYSPGGYFWKPAKDEQVAVLHMGAEQEAPGVVGRVQDETGEELEVGDVLISGNGTRLLLNRWGLDVTGEMTINGKKLEDLIQELIEEIMN